MLTLILGVSALLAGPAAAAGCSQATLEAAAQKYVAAVTAGTPNLPMANGASYTENFKAANVKSGVLSKPVKISHSRSLYDTTECATYTELIAPDNTPAYVIGSQIHYDPSGQIIKMETITTTKGDWEFNAAKTLSVASKESRPIIPEGKRDSRATIQAAADAYLDSFGKSGIKIPWNTPCSRLEGSMVVPVCSIGMFSSGMQMTDRRYVIDVPYGTVDVFVKFGGFMPDSHEFRVENGKIRYVHTLTKMGGKS